MVVGSRIIQFHHVPDFFEWCSIQQMLHKSGVVTNVVATTMLLVVFHEVTSILKWICEVYVLWYLVVFNTILHVPNEHAFNDVLRLIIPAVPIGW